jgi:hypothetical protein
MKRRNDMAIKVIAGEMVIVLSYKGKPILRKSIEGYYNSCITACSAKGIDASLVTSILFHIVC